MNKKPERYYIYKATNQINGKCYIGFTNNFKRRKKDHRDAALVEGCPYRFHKAIRKHGFDNFIFEIVFCGWNKKIMLDMETAFMLYYESHYKTGKGYNMVLYGWGFVPNVTEETRAKISAASKKKWEDPEFRENQMFQLKNRSPESREKQAAALRGRPSPQKGKKGKPLAPEVIERRSATMKTIYAESPEARSANYARLKGIRPSKEIFKRVGKENGSKQHYILTYPDGSQIYITYLREFCRENDVQFHTAFYSAKEGRTMKTGLTFTKVNMTLAPEELLALQSSLDIKQKAA